MGQQAARPAPLVTPGQVSAQAGAMAADCVLWATRAALRGEEGPADAVMRVANSVLAAGAADCARIRAEVLAHAPGSQLAPAQRAWFTEVDAGVEEGLRMVAHAQAAAAPMRLSSFDAYLQASEAVIGVMEVYISASIAAFRRRRAWMTEMLSPPAELLSPAAALTRCPVLHAKVLSLTMPSVL